MDPDSGACTNHIENSWACIKRMKLKSGFAKTLIATNFAEFIFRRKFLNSTKHCKFEEFIERGLKPVYTADKAYQKVKNKWEKNKTNNVATLSSHSQPAKKRKMAAPSSSKDLGFSSDEDFQ